MSDRNIFSKYFSYVSSLKNTRRIVILGDSAVGKTSIAKRFVDQTFSTDYDLTVAGNFFTNKLPTIYDKPEIFIISDVAGQKRFENVRSAFFNGSEFLLAVCDLTRKNTLRNLESVWIPEFLHAVTPKDGFRVKIQIVGNKCDLADLLVISMDDMDKIASSIGRKYPNVVMQLPCLLTSAKDNLFIDEAFGAKRKFIPLFYSR